MDIYIIYISYVYGHSEYSMNMQVCTYISNSSLYICNVFIVYVMYIHGYATLDVPCTYKSATNVYT